MNRRHFLKSSAALAISAPLIPPPSFDDRPRRVGLIGAGWYGKVDLFRLLQVAPVEVVSICDTDRRMREDAAAQIAARQRSKKEPRLYGDYRAMLAERDLDLVLIATPDHWHALPTIEAVRAGADVYVQKPISLDVVEGQAMVAAARKYGRVVQVGVQRRSTPHLVEARDEIVRAGKLGKVSHVELYCYYPMRAKGTPALIPPPEHLDYELWTGPAPMLPYNEWTHPGGWRQFMAYGNGVMGDMCIHMLDTARWMLDLGWPARIASSGGILVDKSSLSDIPDTQTATFEYPDEDLTMVWQHRTWGAAPDPQYPWGLTLYGEKGTLKASVMGYDFIPTGDAPPVRRDVTYELDQYPEDRTEQRLERHAAPAIRGHMRDFLHAVDHRSRPVADIEEGHISTAACILANLALGLGRTLEWDAATETVVADDEANALLRRPYRAPWVHPEPGTV